MLKKVTFADMKKLIEEQNPAFHKDYVEKKAKELIEVLDPRLDDVIEAYCKTSVKTDFSATQNGETFSLYEIMAMRNCSYYEAILLLDAFMKDAKTGRVRILRR